MNTCDKRFYLIIPSYLNWMQFYSAEEFIFRNFKAAILLLDYCYHWGVDLYINYLISSWSGHHHIKPGTTSWNPLTPSGPSLTRRSAHGIKLFGMRQSSDSPVHAIRSSRMWRPSGSTEPSASRWASNTGTCLTRGVRSRGRQSIRGSLQYGTTTGP